MSPGVPALPYFADLNWTPGIGDPTWSGWLTAVAYLVAAVLCGRTSRRHKPREAWLALAAIYAGLAINKQLDLQTLLTAFGRQLFREWGLYDERRSYQLGFMVIVAVLGMLATGWLWWRLSSMGLGPRLAALGAALTVVYVLFRAASLHHVDALVRIPLGSIPLRSVFENAGTLLTVLGATIALRGRTSRAPHSRSPIAAMTRDG